MATTDPLAAFHESRAALVAERDALRAQLDAIEQALGNTPSPAKRPPSLATWKDKVTSFLQLYPEATTTAMAAHFRCKKSTISVALYQLRQQGVLQPFVRGVTDGYRLVKAT